MTPQQGIWATKRLLFHAYIGFCLLSVVGGWLTGPLFTYSFYGDWRFWRYFKRGGKLFLHGYKFLIPLIKWDNEGFMFSVPLTTAPFTAPDRAIVQLSSSWGHGTSCGGCTRCCDKIQCPILDAKTGLCQGYNSFFWRYFNCGRFPSIQREIDYYGCPKWVMRPQPIGVRVAVTGRPAVVESGDEVLGID